MDGTEVGSARKWVVAARTFALPASTTPVIFGTAMAVVVGGAPLNIPLFLVSLVAMMLLHAAANMINDAIDFRRGLDVSPTPTSGAVVRRYLTPSQALWGATIAIALGSILGMIVVAAVGWPIFWLGIVGIAIGVTYTAGPFALKYHGLGDAAVFLDFGILGCLGAWTVQTGRLSWLPVVWAIPMSLLVIGILHANNWRDSQSDRQSRIVTVAALLGDRGSLRYYGFLIFAPVAITCALVGLRLVRPDAPVAMPLPFLITLLCLPLSLRLWRRAINRAAPRQPLDFVALDGATAQLNLAFGLLATLALVIQHVMNRLG
jgi:1,4-dihydroxy-2-naphthoate polyprenyltransferase